MMGRDGLVVRRKRSWEVKRDGRGWMGEIVETSWSGRKRVVRGEGGGRKVVGRSTDERKG